ncbi:MAG: hypothetical protein M0R46_11055 [Candidatus Muirbacterium halophilum]|nr:hypothetical protein [Candidatus Muirbacterium halophilum]MCK9476453.1 hypothetical protein [Candidatus Muirbacterium halophilum]
MNIQKKFIIFFIAIACINCYANDFEKVFNFLKSGDNHLAFQEIEGISSTDDTIRIYSSIAKNLYYEKENINLSSTVCHGAVSFAFRKYYSSNTSSKDEFLFKVSNLCDFILKVCWNDFDNKKVISQKTLETCLKIANENVKIAGILKKPEYELALNYFLLSRINFIENDSKKAFHNINMAIKLSKNSDLDDYNYYNAYNGFYNTKFGNLSSGKSIIELAKINLRTSKKEKAQRYIEEIKKLL